MSGGGRQRSARITLLRFELVNRHTRFLRNTEKRKQSRHPNFESHLSRRKPRDRQRDSTRPAWNPFPTGVEHPLRRALLAVTRRRARGVEAAQQTEHQRRASTSYAVATRFQRVMRGLG